MHTIRLDVSNDIYDKVMFILENLPKNKVKLQLEKDDNKIVKKEKNSLVEFFQSSPLVGTVLLDREQETYEDRVKF
jgi:hypothetical protein